MGDMCAHQVIIKKPICGAYHSSHHILKNAYLHVMVRQDPSHRGRLAGHKNCRHRLMGLNSHPGHCLRSGCKSAPKEWALCVLTQAGLEPAIFGFVDRRLIHWATVPRQACHVMLLCDS